jgi:hypothetical protein
LRVPPEYQSLARKLGLNDWVDRDDFPREAYFKTVDDFRAIIRRHQPQGENLEADWNQLVPPLASMLEMAGPLEKHAVENDSDIADHDGWLDICAAAAWVVLVRYDVAVTNGKWSPE